MPLWTYLFVFGVNHLELRPTFDPKRSYRNLHIVSRRPRAALLSKVLLFSLDLGTFSSTEIKLLFSKCLSLIGGIGAITGHSHLKTQSTTFITALAYSVHMVIGAIVAS
jgi:hypothetical protein